MMNRWQKPEALPGYHDDLVFVSVSADKPIAKAVQAAGYAAASKAGVAESVARAALGPNGDPAPTNAALQKALDGIMALAHLGHIVSIDTIASSADLGASLGTSPQGVLISIAESLTRGVVRSARGSGGEQRLRGTSLVRVSDKGVVNRMIELGTMDSGVSISKVPARYLQVRPPRKAAKKAARPGPVAAAVPPATSAVHWHLNRTGTLRARENAMFQEPRAIRVAVLDTGIDEAHHLLSGRIKKYFPNYANLPVVSGPADIVGHGTHVAGTIAAKLDAATGISGMCEVELWPLKIFDDKTQYYELYDQFMYVVNPAMYLRALVECAENDIHVVNLSIGGPNAPSPEESAQFHALQTESNCTIVAAMGNDRSLGSPISYPAAIPGVIAVGATDAGDRVTQFSNRGPHISLCAPGQAIWATLPTKPGQSGFYAENAPSGGVKEGRPIPRETIYGELDGTSMAAPQVAAAAAMYLAKHPGAAPVDVRSALQRSAAKVPNMAGRDFHEDYGHGRLDVERLLDSAGDA